jgi:hypothetical protein
MYVCSNSVIFKGSIPAKLIVGGSILDVRLEQAGSDNKPIMRITTVNDLKYWIIEKFLLRF